MLYSAITYRQKQKKNSIQKHNKCLYCLQQKQKQPDAIKGKRLQSQEHQEKNARKSKVAKLHARVEVVQSMKKNGTFCGKQNVESATHSTYER